MLPAPGLQSGELSGGPAVVSSSVLLQEDARWFYRGLHQVLVEVFQRGSTLVRQAEGQPSPGSSPGCTPEPSLC